MCSESVLVDHVQSGHSFGASYAIEMFLRTHVDPGTVWVHDVFLISVICINFELLKCLFIKTVKL